MQVVLKQKKKQTMIKLYKKYNTILSMVGQPTRAICKKWYWGSQKYSTLQEKNNSAKFFKIRIS